MKKWSLTLKVFLILLAIGVLYVLVRSIIRVSIGEITSDMVVPRIIIGSIMYVAGAGVLAGITTLAVAVKKPGD
jgi:uncharacterized membrane protein